MIYVCKCKSDTVLCRHYPLYKIFCWKFWISLAGNFYFWILLPDKKYFKVWMVTLKSEFSSKMQQIQLNLRLMCSCKETSLLFWQNMHCADLTLNYQIYWIFSLTGQWSKWSMLHMKSIDVLAIRYAIVFYFVYTFSFHLYIHNFCKELEYILRRPPPFADAVR